jgi:copper chaperone CopZ
MKNIMIAIAAFITFTGAVQAQKEKKTDTVQIRTSAVCDMCKETLEKAMAYEKGVKSSDLNVDTKMLTVVFDPAKTSAANIRKAVTDAGYDADEQPANTKAYDALNLCCKKDAVH